MMFCELCEHDSHRETILNLAYDLSRAFHEESLAHDAAMQATRRRMDVEASLRDIVGVVCRRSGVAEDRVNGVHSSDEPASAEGEV